jgi:hypothetical protein
MMIKNEFIIKINFSYSVLVLTTAALVAITAAVVLMMLWY